MKFIYVCSPYEGAKHEYKAAVEYGRYVKNSGSVPIIPHIMLHGIYSDKVFEEKEVSMYVAKRFMEMSSEVWVFGKQRTFRMKEELALAAKLGVPIKYIAPVKTAMNNDELRQICRDYEMTTGCLMNGIIGNDIMFYLECGIKKEVIAYAITAQARKCAGWNYARAILERCRTEKIKTMDDLNRKAKEKERQKNKVPGAAYDLELVEKKINSPDYD